MLSTPGLTFPRNPHPTLHQQNYSHSTTQGNQGQPPQAKKRRTDRACDACRRKKIRCDGPWTVSNVCTNCVQTRKLCTYLEASKPRGPPKAYVTGLEDRIEELEALLAQIRPHTNFSEELGPPVIRNSWKNSSKPVEARDGEKSASPQPTSEPPFPSTRIATAPLAPIMTPLYPSPRLAGGLSPLVIARTTHLLFNVPHTKKLKKRSSRTGSEVTISSSSASGSGSATATTAPSHHSPSSYTSVSATSDSESSSLDGNDRDSDSDSEELVASSVGGRTRIMLRADETLKLEDNSIRFHGRSSTAGLVETTRRFKHIHMEETMRMEVEERDEQDEEQETQSEGKSKGKSKGKEKEVKTKAGGPDNTTVAMTRRPEFWRTPPWELLYEGQHSSSPPNSILPYVLSHFPPLDLSQSLIQLYFTHSNNHFPLLHRPTFDRQWREGLHEKNVWFACVCLMMFAVASRWSDDERVLIDPKSRAREDDPKGQDGEKDEEDKSKDGKGEGPGDGRDGETRRRMDEQYDSVKEGVENTTKPEGVGASETKQALDWSCAGSKYFEVAIEIHRLKRSLFYPANLFEIQTFTLIGMYLRGTQAFPAAWLIIAIGLRKAQDVGAHRHKVYRGTPNADDELWKRAFWHLVVFDRLGCVMLGRAGGITEEDFDIDLPIDVDDEYWEGKDAWKQPEGIPSIVSAFNYFIKLTQIIAFTLRTVYAIDKSKVFFGLIEGDWRNEVITQLNTAMDEWLQSLPQHLQWSEDITDDTFFAQASTLFTTYHLTRLLIYRPFIPTPPLLPHTLNGPEHRDYCPPPAPFPYPALALCITSSRNCIRVVEAQMRRGSWEGVHIPNMVQVAYVGAGLLILSLWDLKAQEKVLKRVRSAGIIAASGDGDTRKEKVKCEADCDEMNTQSDGEGDGANPDSVAVSLNQKMDELKRDIKVAMDALEWVKPKWELAGPFLEQLRESFPGEEPHPVPSTPPEVPSRDAEETARKKESFQDLRRQRQLQQQQTKKSSKGVRQPQTDGTAASLPVDATIHHRASHPSLPSLGTAARNDAPHLTRRSSAPFALYQAAQQGSYHNTPDPALFIRAHFPGLHTFIGGEFDDPNERVIRLPQVNYKVSSHTGTHTPTTDKTHSSDFVMKSNATLWPNSDTSSTPSPLLYSSHNVPPQTPLQSQSCSGQPQSPLHHQQLKLNPTPSYPHIGRPRTYSATAATFPVNRPMPFTSSSMRRTSMSNLPLGRQSQNDGVRLHDVYNQSWNGNAREPYPVESVFVLPGTPGTRISPSGSMSSLIDTRGTSRNQMAISEDVNIHCNHVYEGQRQSHRDDINEGGYQVPTTRTEALDNYSSPHIAPVAFRKQSVRLDGWTTEARRSEEQQPMNAYLDPFGTTTTSNYGWNIPFTNHQHPSTPPLAHTRSYHPSRNAQASSQTQSQSSLQAYSALPPSSHPQNMYRGSDNSTHGAAPPYHHSEVQPYIPKSDTTSYDHHSAAFPP